MTDAEFLHAFEECAIPNHEFNHRAHIRMAWLYLRQYGYDVGSQKIMEGIKRFAAAHHSQLYHETITRFWIRPVNEHMMDSSDEADLVGFITKYPALTNKSLIYRHYT